MLLVTTARVFVIYVWLPRALATKRAKMPDQRDANTYYDGSYLTRRHESEGHG